MDDISAPVGIAIVVIAALVMWKAAKTVIKIAMAAMIVLGFYVWFGMQTADALLR